MSSCHAYGTYVTNTVMSLCHDYDVINTVMSCLW